MTGSSDNPGARGGSAVFRTVVSVAFVLVVGSIALLLISRLKEREKTAPDTARPAVNVHVERVALIPPG